MTYQYKNYTIRIMEEPKKDGSILFEPSIHELPVNKKDYYENKLLVKEFKTIEEAKRYTERFIDEVDT